MKKLVIGLALAMLAISATPSFAQVPPVKNPVGIAFDSPDHANAAVTGYMVEIVKTDGSVLQTLQIQKSNTTVRVSDGKVVVTINVQPITFGTYTFRAFTVAGTVFSVPSPLSDPWERVAGSPSKPIVQ
jgi:hypothetical protein